VFDEMLAVHDGRPASHRVIIIKWKGSPAENGGRAEAPPGSRKSDYWTM
jgi:hypothetical protein